LAIEGISGGDEGRPFEPFDAVPHHRPRKKLRRGVVIVSGWHQSPRQSSRVIIDTNEGTRGVVARFSIRASAAAGPFGVWTTRNETMSPGWGNVLDR
jgi:hypothetical protein